jgi:hypothetical protein
MPNRLSAHLRLRDMPIGDLGRVLINRWRCPLCADTDRLCAAAANDAMGQFRKSAVDQFVCSREQRRRHGETEGFSSSEVDD